MRKTAAAAAVVLDVLFVGKSRSFLRLLLLASIAANNTVGTRSQLEGARTHAQTLLGIVHTTQGNDALGIDELPLPQLPLPTRSCTVETDVSPISLNKSWVMRV